ncbi:ATP-dependent RNA helicase HrpA [Flavimobilis sp. GY10621]|uniref:ATP-dependent RNA helicase HrpA n=1 Tax=Flavimobilis rhizosphaerae TaxID=2775421 RepID=A0ABR9DQA8_9MICO|nr:ATP-dependent RNA helicase HrpA [Flavimobilis rhizosphaerae]MBD9699293.1 ATP-dependent RNA helicase HrpA [Flavimobilis rhizosphaerae]
MPVSTPSGSSEPEGRPRRGRGGRGRGPAQGSSQGSTQGSTQRSSQAGGKGRGRGRRDTFDRETLDARALARAARAAEIRARVDVPAITYPENLPVSGQRSEIADAIRDHQVVIVAGATGSGKTTQLPKILLDLGRGRAGQIGHTQPRRLAARTVAERIAEEIGDEHTGPDGQVRRGRTGGVVGYQVRFTDESSDRTLVKVMTDGILLAQIQRDPLLRAYDTLVIDEAHERSLNIDFLLGYLTQLLPQRPDLKLVITSATIDSERFAEHFASVAADGTRVSAPVIEVSGRTYPVEIRYRPLVEDLPDPAEDKGTPTGAVGGGKAAKKKRPARAVERDLMTGICEAVDELFAEGPGDILVFLSGEREIRDAADALRGHLGDRVDGRGTPLSVEVVPLYARLSAAEQHRVFEPHGGRRIVLATNVAETSLTVPGIRYVIDPGTARISRYSKATKVQRLPIEPVSQASANQRSGRCGRVADGIAIRLYSESDFEGRPEFTDPEILRTSLASVILQMISSGVANGPDDVAGFPFVDPPDVRAVRDGVNLLTELGALADGASLTATGRTLSRLPMDPRLGRMIIEGARRGVGREVLIVTAVLSIQDPRERPTEQRQHADQLHARFADPTSDFLTYLNLWEYLKEQRRALSSSAFRRLCKAEFINFLRVREWQDLVGQLKDMAEQLDLEIKPASRAVVADGSGRGVVRRSAPGARALSVAEAMAEAAEKTGEAPEAETHRYRWDGDTIHRALLAGMLSQIGMQQVTEVGAQRPGRPAREDRRAARQARNEYVGARNAHFAIFPGSPLSKKPPAWIMAGELVETSRLWAREVARIEPEWAEEIGAHLVKHVYSEPHWSSKQGAAQAFEKVLLHGLPIVAQRKVLFSRVDPEGAREMFLRKALVEGEWSTRHEFFARNRELLDEAEQLEARTRRRDLVVDDDTLFAFYDARVPADVVSARHFDRWWKDARRTDPELLTFTPELLVPEAGDVDLADYPDTWEQGDLRLPLTYELSPGQQTDGVTVHVPLAVLDRVVPDGFDWLVPGMWTELATATIRALPKPVRVQLVPAPDVARDVVAWLRAHEASWADLTRAGDMAPSFHEAFARAVRALRDVVVPDDAWGATTLPDHLRMQFRVVDSRGTIVDEGADLLALQRRLRSRTQAEVRTAVRTALADALREAGAPAPSGSASPSAPTRRSGAPSNDAGDLPVDPPDPTRRSGAPSNGAGDLPVEEAGVLLAEQERLTTWPTLTSPTGEPVPGDALPDEVVTRLGAGPSATTVRGYPALVVELAPAGAKGGRNVESVALRILADRRRQAPDHAAGVRALLLAETGLQTQRVTTRWTGQQALTLASSPYRSTDALVGDVQKAAIAALTSGSEPGVPEASTIRSREAYEGARGVVRERLEERVHQIVGHVVAALAAARELDTQVRTSTSLALLNTLTDVRDDAARLVFDGFVTATPPERLRHLPRYLRAASHRLTKAEQNPNRDAELAWRIRDVEDVYDRARAAYAAGKPDDARLAALEEARWMLEELRVSFFAQQLGTDGTVSEKRVRALLAG